MTRSFLRKIYSRREINIILGGESKEIYTLLPCVVSVDGMEKKGGGGVWNRILWVWNWDWKNIVFESGDWRFFLHFFFFCWWNFIFGFRYSFCKRLMEHGRWNILFRNRIFACYCKRRLNGIFREKYERFSSAVRMTSSDEIAWFPIGHSIVRN